MIKESHLRKDSPIPDTPPRLDLEENEDPDPDRINLNPVDPELNPIAPEGPVIPNIPEVIPGPTQILARRDVVLHYGKCKEIKISLLVIIPKDYLMQYQDIA